MLSKSFGLQNISIVAEEDFVKARVIIFIGIGYQCLNGCLVEAPRYNLQGPDKALSGSQILDVISQYNSTRGLFGRHWVLDPVDGTLGFVRGDQYAVALAMIDDGEVVIGVLGCPNYPMEGDGLNKYRQHNHVISKIQPEGVGCIMYTSEGTGRAWMQPLIHSDGTFEWPNSAMQIRVSSIEDPESATFCEPVEMTNSNHSFVVGVADTVGLRKKPLRVYSMVKYAAIARGDAEIYMRCKVWVQGENMGSCCWDSPCARSWWCCHGCGSKLHEKIIDAIYSSWESSNL